MHQFPGGVTVKKQLLLNRREWVPDLLTGNLSPPPLLPQPLLQMSRSGLQRERADVAVPQRKLSPHPPKMEIFCRRWCSLYKDGEVCTALQRQCCGSSEANTGTDRSVAKTKIVTQKKNPSTRRPFKKKKKEKKWFSCLANVNM